MLRDGGCGGTEVVRRRPQAVSDSTDVHEDAGQEGLQRVARARGHDLGQVCRGLRGGPQEGGHDAVGGKGRPESTLYIVAHHLANRRAMILLLLLLSVLVS